MQNLRDGVACNKSNRRVSKSDVIKLLVFRKRTRMVDRIVVMLLPGKQILPLLDLWTLPFIPVSIQQTYLNMPFFHCKSQILCFLHSFLFYLLAFFGTPKAAKRYIIFQEYQTFEWDLRTKFWGSGPPAKLEKHCEVEVWFYREINCTGVHCLVVWCLLLHSAYLAQDGRQVQH